MKKLVFLVLTLGGLGFGTWQGLQIYLAKSLALSSPEIIEVKKGSSLTSIAGNLNKRNIIQYPRLLVKMGQILGYADRIKYGEYQITPQDSYRDLLEKIVSGDNHRYSVTLVEGDHIYKLADQLASKGLVDKKRFLTYIKSPETARSLLGVVAGSLEGYLFPDTYHFSKTDGMKTIVKTMVDKFLSETKNLNLSTQGLNRHQVVTLASIIEKETGAAFERPLISSVFHNRLKKKMRLQTDPTIIYGIMDQTGREIKNIRKKDIRKPTPYNTYVIKGLPPGPIGNPGIEAIKAAIRPKKSEFLYFVSQNDGTHVFSENYDKHLKAVRDFQLNPEARKGKSWRDLNKKTRTR